MATLLALLQSSLEQRMVPEVCKAEAQLKPQLDSCCAYASQMQVKARELPLEVTASGGNKDFASLLTDLVRVAAEIARMDEMLAQTKASAPASADARKWHHVSIQALMWSRETLAEEQKTLLLQLKVLVKAGHTGLARGASTAYATTETRSPTQPQMEHSREAQTRELAGRSLCLEPPESAAAVVGSLRVDLERVRTYEKERCLLVRKIKQLGLESSQKLREHFELYGAVSEVLVAHSFEKPSAKRRSGRMRPAAIGFIVMATGDAANAILSAGESHMVEDGADSCEVLVQSYNPQVAACGLDLTA